MARNLIVTAVIFLLAAFLPKPFAFWVFGIGVLGTQAVYMIPKISPLRFERFVPRFGHMAERFALLTLIVLGEGFFKLVVTLAEKGIYKVGAPILMNFTLGGIAIFALCWLYFDFVGNAKAKNGEIKTLVIWWLGHLFLMMCGVMVGVALAGMVKVGFTDPFPADYAKAGCFGLAGFIAMVWLLENNVEDREAHRFGTWEIRTAGIALALITYAIVSSVPAFVGTFVWSTALYSQLAIPFWRGIMALR